MFERHQAADSDHQIAMVIDLNKCMGCQTCTVSCKTLWTSDEGQEDMWWNKVNTMPGEGSPRGWEDMGGGFNKKGKKFSIWRFLGGDMNESELPSHDDFGKYKDIPSDTPFQGKESDAFTAPVEDTEWMYNYDEDKGEGEHPNQYLFYMPRLCNHCTRPACLEACPRDAIYKRKEDGIVLIDEEMCNGYRFCMEACPYKVIYFNTEEGKATMSTEPGDLTVEEVMTDGGPEPNAQIPTEGVAQKCIGCYPRIEKGVAPACVRQCPGRARFYGYLDDESTEVHKLVNEWGVALPLHPDYNTEPNVYYVPPLSSPKIDDEEGYLDEDRIPLSYLEELFGPNVGEALEILKNEREKMKKGKESGLMDILIGYQWPDDFFGSFTKNPENAKQPIKDKNGGLDND